MSNAKRKGLEFTADQIGKAKIAFKNLIGDTFSLLGPKYDLENNLIKLRGSTLFHDYDLNKKDPFGISQSEFTTFDTRDIANYTVQGGSIGVTNTLSFFPNFLNWNPQNYGPPSLEGWLIYEYNAWSNYIPKYSSTGGTNSSYVVYSTSSEPNSGSGRTNYSYPVRYTGTSYTRVPLFNFARIISVKNTSGDSSKDTCVFTIPKSEFTGLQNINPKTNLPTDFAIYSHRYLISDSLVSGMTLAGTMGLAGISDTLGPLGYTIQETNSLGSVTRERDYYTVSVNLPSSSTWTANKWFHMFVYWGTRDNYFQTGYPTYSAGNAVTQNYSALDTNLYYFPTKSFFNKNLKNELYINKTGVNDQNLYLYNPNNTNHTFKESVYSDIKEPFRYKINQSLNTGSGTTNSFSQLVSPDKNEYYSALVVIKNSGLFYDDPENHLELVLGPTLTIQDLPDTWEEFQYYPEIPKNYNLIAKVILSYTNQKSIPYFNATTAYKQDASIVYIDMVSDNSIVRALGDENISRYFSNPIYKLLSSLRKDEYKKHINILSQKLVSRFARYEINKIKSENYFRNLSSRDYVALHNLFKLPVDTLLQNTEEPYNINFSEKALEIISDYSILPATKDIAGFASTYLYINNIKLSSDTEFEVYLEKYSNPSFSQVVDTGNSLEKDYSFRIKFKNQNNQFTLKDLFVNASKYYLTDSEYQNRVDKKLSVTGYYKKSLLDNISDFKVFSYAGLVPDLKMGTYQKITNKENAPSRTDRITESEYEASLPTGLSKDEINNYKTGFGYTDSFYTVDSSKPSDNYSGIDELGVTISDYTYLADPYWLDNTKFLYGDLNTNNINNAKHINDLRNDSFVIGLSGYGTNDSSINLFENYKDQQLISNLSSSINKFSQLGLQKIQNNKIAIRISCDVTQEVKSVRIKLRKTSDYINKNAEIKCYLYSNLNDSPNEKLASGTSILLKNIDNKLKGYDFYIDYKLFENKIYWLVLETTTLPPTYDPYVNGLINISNGDVTGIYNITNNTFANFSRYLPGAEIGYGSTSGTAITTWYAISSVGSSTQMSIASIGQTVTRQFYSVRYSFDLGIVESSSVGASTNLAIYNTGTGWSSYEGTASIEFYKPDSNVYGGFNKDFTTSNLTLSGPNRYRETDNYFVDGFVSFNSVNLPANQNLTIYPRSVAIKKFEMIGTGSSATNKVSIGATNYNPKTMIGLGISQSYYFAAGTSITDIQYNLDTNAYDIYLSSNVLNNLSDKIVGIGSSSNVFVKRANDINVIINYKANGSLGSTTIILAKSPSWITKLYKKNRYTYTDLDKTAISDLIDITDDLRLSKISISDQYKYLNGYAVGDFIPNSGLGKSFEFKFVSAYGLRVFVNDESAPYINQWKADSSTGATFQYNISNVSDPIKLEVQFNNFTSSTGATVLGFWRKKGTTAWLNFDSSFYYDAGNTPVTIGSTYITNITFVNVAKNASELQSQTFGSPTGDRIVIRST